MGISSSQAQDISTVGGVILNNTIAFTLLCLIPIYGGIFYSVGQPTISISLLLLVLFAGITYWLNWKQLFNLAKYWTTLFLNTALFVYSVWIGKDSGIHYLAFVFLTFSFSMYSYKEPGRLLFGILLPMSAFFLVEWSDMGNTSLLDEFSATVIQKSVMILVFVWLIISVLHSSYIRDKTNEELRSSLEERNSEIKQREEVQRQLANSHRILEEKNTQLEYANNRAKRFAFRLSHEMRKPLANILGLSYLHNIEESDETKLEIVQKIGEESEHMDKIIHQANRDLNALN